MMFGKILKKIVLPLAKRAVEKEIEKKIGKPVKIDDIIDVAKNL